MSDTLTLLEAAATTTTIQDIAHLLLACAVEAGLMLALPHLSTEVRRQLTSH